jgi:hypothetical protein
MTSTSPRVLFGLYALEVKPDSMLSMSGLQAFSKLDDLRTDSTNPRPYATYEPDFWLLDGGYKFLPVDTSNVHVGVMTTAQSNGSGVFASPPGLTIIFSEEHIIDGLVLRFAQYSNDYANSINVRIWDIGGNLQLNQNYTPTSWEFSVAFDDMLVFQIIILFNSTNKLYRYLRLTAIDYGELIYFEGADIRQASLVEEISMIGTEAPVGTLELLLHSDDAEFSMLNPAGHYTTLEQRQPVTVYEQVDAQTLLMGQYYLNVWKNQSDTEIEFEAVDLLGVLDTIPCVGGMYASLSLSGLVSAILTPLFIPYEIDASLSPPPITGWIPYGTCREALQQIACAVGAYLTCARSGSVRILKTKLASEATTWDAEITRADKGSPQSLELKSLVTGVDVTAHNYIVGTSTEKVYDGTLTVGTHQIVFDRPMTGLSITGATLTVSDVNYATVEVATEGTVTLIGYPYIDTLRIYSMRDTTLSALARQNILKITDATLINNANAQAVAERAYAYHRQRYKQTVRLYAPTVELGNVTKIETLYNQQLLAVIEKMEIDLAGGFVADVEMTGVEYGLG